VVAYHEMLIGIGGPQRSIGPAQVTSAPPACSTPATATKVALLKRPAESQGVP
jgi:hypothetical protein